ncbi:MAG: hypothetical protein HY321_00705, partial [Armatimonadetes bacterium]|nr:hypothetical protein [Armatimonadota bacterium]
LLERALSDPTREAVLCLNFGPPSLSQMQVLGTPRVLQMHVGGALAFSSGVAGPPLLPYLPAGDPVLQKPASLDLEETPLAEAADRIAKLLGAPVVAQEPAEAMTLTASFRDAPLRRVLHWVERHTNLRWRRRAGIYVLAPPVPVARLAADPKAALSLLTRGIPSYPPISPREMTLAITEQDRRALESGLVPLSQLSPGLEDAIRGRLYSDAERMASSIRTSLELLGRLNEARLRLEPMLPARGRDPDALLYVELSEDVKAGFVIPSESRPNQ